MSRPSKGDVIHFDFSTIISNETLQLKFVNLKPFINGKLPAINSSQHNKFDPVNSRFPFQRLFPFFIKDAVKSVLRISSAHNKGGPADINIAQILHLSNFFELNCLLYIHLQA